MTETLPWGPTQAMDAAFAGAFCEVLGAGGGVGALAVQRWRQAPSKTDHRLFLDHCAGPTLDVGCGPGRLVGALAARGVPALGIDVSGEAVLQARARGAMALRRDVFETVPGSGRWAQVLLADGNIGIGGDPIRLLHRVHDLLRPGGAALVEVDPPGIGVASEWVRLQVGAQTTDPFRWARVGLDAIGELAGPIGLGIGDLRLDGGRHLAILARPAVGSDERCVSRHWGGR